MKSSWPKFLFLALLAFARPALAADAIEPTTLHKSDIKALKMFSVAQDKIIVFVTDQHDVKYRLGSMNKADVSHLLDALKKPETGVTITAKAVANKKYLEVTAWK